MSSHSREVSVVLVVDEALQALLNVRLVLVYHLLVLLELRQLLQSHGIADGSVGSLRAEISGVGIGSGTSRVGLPTHFKIAKTTTSSWGVVVWGVVRGIVCGGGGLATVSPGGRTQHGGGARDVDIIRPSLTWRITESFSAKLAPLSSPGPLPLRLRRGVNWLV